MNPSTHLARLAVDALVRAGVGHVVLCPGSRSAPLAYELQRREARYGLETMCIGGGQGLAAIFERVSA